MVRLPMRRISAAKNLAQDMGFERTAERLAVLQRELGRFKELDSRGRENKLWWAVAKIDDTRKTMGRELSECREKKELEYSDERRRDISFITRTMFYLAAITFSMNILRSAQSYAAIALTSLGMLMVIPLGALLQKFVGPVDREKGSARLGRMLDRCAGMLESMRVISPPASLSREEAPSREHC